ncbi:MAG: hypothetical protein KAI64_01410, partial [Thermoplasmata archaeon]|nr:hypothetical protein [Thermoplasmata archaeon]
LLIGLSLAFLPWLHERYSLAPLVLAAFFMTRISFRKKGLVPFLAPLVVSVALLSWYYITLYGSPFPGFGYPASPRDRFEPIGGLFKGFLGFIFDRDFGLLIYSPVYLLILVGVLLSLRYFRKESLWLLVLIAVLYFVPAFYAGWCWSKCPSLRFLVATVPLFGVFMAVAFDRIERGSFKFLTYTLLTISLLVALYSVRHPHELYFRSAEGSYVLTEFMKTHHLLAIDRLLPSFAKGLSFAELPVFVWAGLIIALSLRYYHGHVKRESTVISPTGSGQ